MPSDDSPIGYKRPPVHSRFQKGQSGNPRGRPKKLPDFMEDAAEIVGGTVIGQAKGKSITLPAVQAMFRILCHRALKGDNRALREIIELMLTLEPVARDNAQEAEEKEKANREIKKKFFLKLGIDVDQMEEALKKPDPERKEREKRFEAMVREEHQRLIRARRSQGKGPTQR
jgi:Family of unknown function (DUF5681)